MIQDRGGVWNRGKGKLVCVCGGGWGGEAAGVHVVRCAGQVTRVGHSHLHLLYYSPLVTVSSMLWWPWPW